MVTFSRDDPLIWFEEDEALLRHARGPHKRVAVAPSSRSVRVLSVQGCGRVVVGANRRPRSGRRRVELPVAGSGESASRRADLLPQRARRRHRGRSAPGAASRAVVVSERRAERRLAFRGAVDQVLRRVRDRPVYVSVDIGVLDPAFAPGTCTPEVGGRTSCELLSILRSFADLNPVGADIVGVTAARRRRDDRDRAADIACGAPQRDGAEGRGCPPSRPRSAGLRTRQATNSLTRCRDFVPLFEHLEMDPGLESGDAPHSA
jgi:Arginase family